MPPAAPSPIKLCCFQLLTRVGAVQGEPKLNMRRFTNDARVVPAVGGLYTSEEKGAFQQDTLLLARADTPILCNWKMMVISSEELAPGEEANQLYLPARHAATRPPPTVLVAGLLFSLVLAPQSFRRVCMR